MGFRSGGNHQPTRQDVLIAVVIIALLVIGLVVGR